MKSRPQLLAIRRLPPALALVLGLGLVFGLSIVGAPPVLARQTVDLFEPDIVGGQDADPGEWPHQVAILDPAMSENIDAQYCGGALIDLEWVLTAAHCVEGAGANGELNASGIQVGLGMHDLESGDGRRVAVAQIVMHPDYYESGFETGDIALVRLAAAATVSSRVKPIALVEQAADAALQLGKPAWVTGWGMIDDGNYASILQEVDVPFVSEALCRADSGAPLNGESLCAGTLGRDSCYGDSGGPLVVDSGGSWRLAGVVSAGTTDTCGGEDNYTLYTSVPHYLDWIRRTMADRGPDLELAVAAPEIIRPAQRFQYTVTVRNTGRQPAADLTLADTLPPGLRFLSASDGGRLVLDQVRWQLGSLAPGQSKAPTIGVEEDPALPGSPLAVEPEALTAGADVDPGDEPPDGDEQPDGDSGSYGDGGFPGHTKPAAPAVVGGRNAARQAWPWQVLLYAQSLDIASGQFCGGTVIEPSWVLTAAHCVYEQGLLAADLIGIMAGSNSLADDRTQVLAEPDGLFLNARYLLDENADLALVHLKQPLPIGPSIAAVPLAGAADGALRAPGTQGVVTGWGATDGFGEVMPDLLQEARIPIVGGGRCAEEVDREQQLCAGKPEGGASACFGDSGGPFVVQKADGSWTQVGIVSAVTDDTCGVPGSLSLFTRVDAFAPWIALKLATGKQDKVLINTEVVVDATGIEPIDYYGEALTVVDPLAAPATPPAGATAAPTTSGATAVPTATVATPATGVPPVPTASAATATRPRPTGYPPTYLPFLLRRP